MTVQSDTGGALSATKNGTPERRARSRQPNKRWDRSDRAIDALLVSGKATEEHSVHLDTGMTHQDGPLPFYSLFPGEHATIDGRGGCRMGTQEQPVPPLTAFRRAQIHQILAEYGDKQVRSSLNGHHESSDTADGNSKDSRAHTLPMMNGDQDEQSDVMQTMEKLRQFIPDSTPYS